jgi:hypothetical protein
VTEFCTIRTFESLYDRPRSDDTSPLEATPSANFFAVPVCLESDAVLLESRWSNGARGAQDSVWGSLLEYFSAQQRVVCCKRVLSI